MNIDALVWDDWNEAHIAGHGVLPEEVEAVCFSTDSLGVRIRKDRYRLIGQSEAGPYLTVIVDSEDTPGTHYVITARGATLSGTTKTADVAREIAMVTARRLASNAKSKPKSKSRIPRFKSREEEAQFWDTHDTTEFEDEFVEVQVRVAKPLAHILGVRLDAKTIDRLGAIGRRKGVGASTLARMWLLERLEREK